ncbi:MAG TPA: PspC family transcriptional regulator [Lachnospiraceae bacterium]|nr:PspC family transcriptional regulator [Lachnospiraceae bacterium]
MSKRLCLSENKKLTGVCGGIAEKFDFEPAIVRIVVVLLALLLKWPVVFIYVVLWIVLPSCNNM